MQKTGINIAIAAPCIRYPHMPSGGALGLEGRFALAPEVTSGGGGWVRGERGRAFMKITEREIRSEIQSKESCPHVYLLLQNQIKHTAKSINNRLCLKESLTFKHGVHGWAVSIHLFRKFY